MDGIHANTGTRLPPTESSPAPMLSNDWNQSFENASALSISDPETKTAGFSSVVQLFDKYKKLSILYTIYLGAGTLCFYLVRHQISGTKTNSFLDALFFTIVRLTSAGYEDLTPDTNLAILLASFFSLVGTFLMGLLLIMFVEMLVMQQKLVYQKIITSATLWKQMESTSVINRCIQLVVSLVFHLAVGTVILVSIEDLGHIHGFYCVSATITTVAGGSDKCFSTKGGRVFALFWTLNGAFYIGYVIYTLMELHAQRRQRLLVEEALKRKTTPADFDEADLDRDGVLVLSEYILYKLREVGKFNQEELGPIIQTFRTLDVNKRGRLTINDI